MPVGRVFFLALALTLANVVLLLAGTASAQSTDDPIEIPTVRVGGKRVVDDAAPSTVIDRSEVREALPTIPDLLHQQPGMRVSRVGGLGSFTTVSIRGSTSEQVRVFVDGIPLDTADGGVVDFTSIPFGPIETIAIYRGVSPLLFGGSAIGGVISMQTRDIGEPHLEVEAGGGSFGTRQARAFYGDGGAGWGVGISLDYTGSQGDFGYLNDNGTLLATSSTDDDVETTRTNAEFDQVATMAKARFHLGGSWQLRALNLLTWQQNGLPGNGTFPTDETSIESIRNISGIRVEGRRIGDFPFETAFGAWLGYTETRLMDPIAEFGILKDD
ncbi:MAG: iron complex outermembrane receptor protein, partial [Myxococcota bacterium]